MAFLGYGPRLLRLQALTRQYLNTHVATIDTAANAVEHGNSDYDLFTSPALVDEDIQVFRDQREGRDARVVWMPSYMVRARELQRTGVSASNVRQDVDLQFFCDVLVAADSGSWGENGAWLRADRLMMGVRSVLMSYPRLDVPDASPALTSIALWSELGDVEMLSESAETMSVALRQSLIVRVMETRS